MYDEIFIQQAGLKQLNDLSNIWRQKINLLRSFYFANKILITSINIWNIYIRFQKYLFINGMT